MSESAFHRSSYKDDQFPEDVYIGIDTLGALHLNIRHGMRFFFQCNEYIVNFANDDVYLIYNREIVAILGAYARLAKLHETRLIGDTSRVCIIAELDAFYKIVVDGLNIIAAMTDTILGFYPPKFEVLMGY